MLKNMTLFDCTLREIGYQTGWYFDNKFATDLYKFAHGKGIDYLELGFFHNMEADPNKGDFRYCSQKNDEIKELFEPIKNWTKLSSMLDIQRPLSNLLPKEDSPIDTIRIITRSHETDFEILSKKVEEIQELGYELFINFTSAGYNSIEKNISFAKFCKKMGVEVMYLADTESVFTCDYINNSMDAIKAENVEVGMHLHNKNGTADMLLDTALSKNCLYTDATLLGLGGKWHDGNIPLEYIIKKFGINGGYELTQLKTNLVQQLIKYHEHTTAILD
ncbi:pyruvate carboxyltransferase [Arcobacter sp. LA11]|uniref:pyruvate carboxyltransferase n=1 Tax=Arcobacter sp. LA11 TaxID=1898176 RepID=UPI00093252A9|nr:pyruvate carboxyltransferase [Arcobacter sp. LA11]